MSALSPLLSPSSSELRTLSDIYICTRKAVSSDEWRVHVDTMLERMLVVHPHHRPYADELDPNLPSREQHLKL